MKVNGVLLNYMVISSNLARASIIIFQVKGIVVKNNMGNFCINEFSLRP